jgi:hypothetical protein
MGFLQNIQRLVSSRPIPAEDRATTFQIHSYGQQNSGLDVEEIQPIMEWVTGSIYLATGYTGKSHLFWLLPGDDFRADLSRLYRKGNMILGYRCGDRMAPAPDGLYWRMVTEHESTRIYQLEEQEE